MSFKSIALVSHDPVFAASVKEMLEPDYDFLAFTGMKEAIDYIYSSMPHLIIFDTDVSDPMPLIMLTNLKSDPLFAPLPVLAVLKETPPFPAWENLYVEDYLRKSDSPLEVRSRVELAILRSERVVEVNPLTRLPGNISINRCIQGFLAEERIFAVSYADLDNFKPFNDYYGFSRGDEVLKMTGRLILNMVKSKQSRGSFVGHVGGDDFVFVMDTDIVEEAAAAIVDAFDRIIPTFYDKEDWAKGYIEAADRQGASRAYPPICLSIGITNNKQRKFSHFGQITEAVSEMKGYAKCFKGSCYKLDKRQEFIDD